MPYSYEVSDADKIIYVTFTGVVTVASSREAMAEWTRLFEKQRDYGTLIDLSRATKLPPPIKMKDIAAAIFEFRHAMKSNVAVLVPPDEVNKASIVCMLVRPFGIRMEAYGEREQAVKFLRFGQSWVK